MFPDCAAFTGVQAYADLH